jgi:creatinine amidohydrolase
MHLEEMNWMDVEKYLETDDRIMVVIGSCEQHGYLSLLTDTKIPLEIADRVSQESGVLVAPPLSFGFTASFLDYPGTVSLRVSTLLDVVEDIVRSFFGQGFRRILLLNGHMGNAPVTARLHELANDLPGLQTTWYNWYFSPGVVEVVAAHDLETDHASWGEAFPFVRVAEIPDKDKEYISYRAVQNKKTMRAVAGDGVFAGPYRVEDDAIYEEMLDAAVSDVLKLLELDEVS